MEFDYRTSTGLGEQTLGGHKESPVCTRTQEKGAVAPQDMQPDVPVSVQKSLAEVSVNSGLPQNLRHCLQQSWEPQPVGIRPFEGDHHYHLYY